LEAEETAASIVSAAKLEQSKVVDEWKSIVKKYREDKAAAAGDEAKELKLESEYTAKRSQYYQKLVQAVTEVKTALEAELSELSQA
jgi:predicted hydrolase (HD superfamily)